MQWLWVLVVGLSVVSAESNSTSVVMATSTSSCDPHYETWNATSQSCVCNDGLHGWGCRMCASNAACQDALRDQVGDVSCVTGFKYRSTTDQKTYQCQIEAGQHELAVGSQMSIHCDRNQRQCILEASSLHCTLTACSVSTGSTDVHCGQTSCHCDGACAPGLKALTTDSLRAVLKATSSARFTINIEDAGFVLPANCEASACESTALRVHTIDGENDGPDAAGATAQQIIRIVVFVMCGILLVTVLWCGCYWKSVLAEFQNWDRTSVCLTAQGTDSEAELDEVMWTEAPSPSTNA